MLLEVIGCFDLFFIFALQLTVNNVPRKMRFLTLLCAMGTVYYTTNESKTRGGDHSAAFVFAAWGIPPPPPSSSKEVPVVLG
jgi:hypothetical protein